MCALSLSLCPYSWSLALNRARSLSLSSNTHIYMCIFRLKKELVSENGKIFFGLFFCVINICARDHEKSEPIPLIEIKSYRSVFLIISIHTVRTHIYLLLLLFYLLTDRLGEWELKIKNCKWLISLHVIYCEQTAANHFVCESKFYLPTKTEFINWSSRGFFFRNRLNSVKY